VMVFKLLYRQLDKEVIKPLKNLRKNWRPALNQILNLGNIVFSALMIWKTLILVTGSESPVVVVLSGSMDPTMSRGDILVLWMPEQIKPGDIIVFQIKEREVPIIHRAIEEHRAEDGSVKILTKGDHNQVHDAHGIYAYQQLWLERSDIMGKAWFFVPQAGYITIWINETPEVKYCVIAAMVIYVLFFEHAE